MYFVIPFDIKVSKGIQKRDHPAVRPREICLGSQGHYLCSSLSVLVLSKRDKII
jgi:hypothetical protein